MQVLAIIKLKLLFLMNKILFALFATVLMSTFSGNAQTKITFLHYNDLHAHLNTHKDLIRSGDACSTDASADSIIGWRGGVARLKTLADSLKSKNPNTIFMNVGDTYHGGVESAYTSGNAIVDPVNALGFDVGVPGNWDFAYGAGVFRKRYTPNGPFPTFLNITLPSYAIKSPSFTYLASNLTYSKLGAMDPSPDGGEVLPPDTIISMNGVNIGIIGITSDIVPTMYAPLAMGFNFLQGETNYVTLINTELTKLKSQGADIIIVMSELGIHKDYKLAQLINPGVSVFFSAHTHEVTHEPLTSASGAVVVEAGNDGFLGKMEITYNNGNVSIDSWNLIPITTDIAEDPSIKSLVDTERAQFLLSNPNLSDPMGTSAQTLNRPITDTLGYSNVTLTRIGALESVFNDAFTEMLTQKSGMQLAMTPGFRFDSPTGMPGFQYEDQTFAIGEITVEDLYRFFPVFYTHATAKVRVDTIKSIVEKLLKNVFSADAFQQGGGWVDGFDGLKIDINLNNADYNKIIQIRDNASQILNNSDTLSIIGCQRPAEDTTMLCSHTGFFDKQDFINSTTGQAWTSIQIMEDYLANNDTIYAPTHKTFTDMSGNATWPQLPWVQALPDSVTCLTVAIDNLEKNIIEFKAYPNPTNDNLTVSIDLKTKENGTLIIRDILGKTHLYQELSLNVGNNQKQLNLSSLSSGIYLMEIQLPNSKTAIKLIKQ